VHLLFIGVFEV